MADDTLDYSIEIDKKIPEAFSKAGLQKVENFKRLTHGEQNYVYKVKTTSSYYVLRVFREKWWPEEDKPLWIEKEFIKYSIPHAKIIYQSRLSNVFPFGFMIMEFLDGENGESVIKNGKLSFEEFHKNLFLSLSKIHQIKIKKYGLIKAGEGEFETYAEFKLNDFRDKKEELLKLKDFNSSLLDGLEVKIKETLSKFEDLFSPTLVHGDATPDNSIYTEDGEVILIDWDDGRSGIWFDDYAWITYCGSHITNKGTLEARRKILLNLMDKYEGNALKSNDLLQLEKLLHLLKTINLLPYYYFVRKNQQYYDKTLFKFNSLLKNL